MELRAARGRRSRSRFSARRWHSDWVWPEIGAEVLATCVRTVADSLIVAVRPHTGLESFIMMLKPIMPFFPFPVRVTNECVAVNLHLSPHHAPDALSASLQEQRGKTRTLRHSGRCELHESYPTAGGGGLLLPTAGRVPDAPTVCWSAE